jgi:hypothetical protein
MEPEQAAPPLAVRLGAAAAVAWLAFWWLGAQDWIQYPFALEWQESAMFEHASRVANGLPLYQAPAVDFTAFPFPPLFHWLGALAVGSAGGDLADLRAVSALSTLVVLVCLVLVGRRRAGWAGGLLGAGLFIAADGWTGTWTLIARVDALSLALTAAALVVGTSARSLEGRPVAGAVAGVLGAAAVLAKQTALGPLVGLVIGLCLRSRSRRAGLVAGGVSAFVLAVAWTLLQGASEGWFGFHVLSVLAGSPLHAPAALSFLPDLLLAWAPLLVLGLVASRASRAGDAGARPGAPTPDAWHPAEWCGLLALIVAAWVGRAHEGGYRNTLLPAALALSFIAGPLVARAATVRPRVAAGLALLLFPWLILSHPAAGLPSEAEQLRMAALQERVGAFESPVWQPHGALDPREPGGVHAMVLVDLLKSRRQLEARAFEAQLGRELDARRFGAIVLGVELSEWSGFEALTRNYEVAERWDGPGAEAPSPLVPATGAPIGPRVLLLPR